MGLSRSRSIGFVLAAGGLLALVMLVLAVQPGRAAGPWYVAPPPDGDDSYACDSPSVPCATIDGAIGKASAGDTINVAIGAYAGSGEEVVRLRKSVTLLGGWDSSFSTQSSTSIVNGQGARRGMTVNAGVTATVDRFVVRNGYTDGDGGGIYNAGTLTMTKSTIRSNSTEDINHLGGGIYNVAALALIGSTVSENISAGGGGILGTGGSTTVIFDSRIYGNTAASGQGGGIRLDSDSRLIMSRSWVVGNEASSDDAGGIGLDQAGSTYLENSIIAGNYAGADGGGLLFMEGGPNRIVNCHVVGNVAAGDGSALAGSSAQVGLTNTLVISNTGTTGIDDPLDSGSEFLLNYCDTYGNAPDGTGSVTITRTNCLGSPPEDGLDPVMVGGTLPAGVGPAFADEWLGYNYRLEVDSAAIDAGTPDGAPSTDIDGNPRDATPDMGAYELASGVYISPPDQTHSGARGEVVAHQAMLHNATGATDTFDLALGSHAWDTSLPASSLGPIETEASAAFTVYVTVPLGVDWYSMDAVTVTATSVTSPTVYTDSAGFSTRAYAPPQIGVSPESLASTQHVNDVVVEPLIVSNGNGVTLTFELVAESFWLSFEPITGMLASLSSEPIQVTFDATGMEPGVYIAEIGITSNDPGRPWVSVPVTMTIEQQAALSLHPALEEGGGLPGENVVYAYTLTNEGDGTDTFSLEANGAWPTTLSADSSGPLGPGETFDFSLEVAVPGEAIAGSSDTATITAVSEFDPVVTGGAEAVTTAGQVAGVSVTPPLRAKSGLPGEDVVYVYSVTNKGNGADTFSLEASGVWMAMPSSTTTGPLDAGESFDVTVTVAVPTTAMSGSSDTATLTARSEADPAVSDSVEAVATAEQQAAVSLTPPHQSGSAMPGESTFYTLTVTNEGNGTDSFKLEASGTWPSALPATTTGPLGAGESLELALEVTIPGTAAPGGSDTTDIVATSDSAPAVSDSAVAVTTAVAAARWWAYLPLIVNGGD